MESSKSSMAASARCPLAVRLSIWITILRSLTGPVISTRRWRMSSGSGATRQSPRDSGSTSGGR